jgi:hypothetical protein
MAKDRFARTAQAFAPRVALSFHNHKSIEYLNSTFAVAINPSCEIRSFRVPFMKCIKDPAERTTAVTDIILAVVAFAGVLFLRGFISHPAILWKINIWSAAIGMIGLAAVLGAAAHGLLLTPTLHHRIWLVLNVALSLAVSLFVVGVVYDLWGFEISLTMLPIMLAAGLGFYLTTLLRPGIFILFIIYEVLALVFALGAYTFLAIGPDLQGAWLIASGIFVSIVAAGIQLKKSVAVTIIWLFDHNGVYHLVQTVGLILLIAGLRWSVLN